MNQPAMHWINGQWTASDDSAEAESINPATGEVIGTFSAGGKAEAETAIHAAKHAFEHSEWAHQPRRRAAVLLGFADRLEAKLPELTRRLTAENGKLLKEAEHELQAAVSELRYYAGLTRNIFGRISEVDVGLYAMLAREPVGVAGIIVPWNGPIALLTRSLAPALAAGCTVVTKAAPQTALVTHEVFKLLIETHGLPNGVVNLIHEMGNDAAKTLVASPDVGIISYTGSTEIGKQIMAAAADTLKILNLELGGSAPCIVWEDADLNRAIPAIAQAGMIMAGQMCTAASRILVHPSRFKAVKAGLKHALEIMVIGAGDDPKSQMGPMIDIDNRKRIENLIAEASGDIILHGRPLEGAHARGAFIGPSLVANPASTSPLVTNEVFGPVLTLDTFENENEAIQKANNTRYGLAASVWTADLQRGHRIANQLRAGTVWINAHNRLMAEAETGGYKESGPGRLHGIEGLDTFLQTKHISWEIF